jgi:hypothetical protein
MFLAHPIFTRNITFHCATDGVYLQRTDIPNEGTNGVILKILGSLRNCSQLELVDFHFAYYYRLGVLKA